MEAKTLPAHSRGNRFDLQVVGADRTVSQNDPSQQGRRFDVVLRTHSNAIDIQPSQHAANVLLIPVCDRVRIPEHAVGGQREPCTVFVSIVLVARSNRPGSLVREGRSSLRPTVSTNAILPLMDRSFVNPLLKPDLLEMVEQNDQAGMREFCQTLYPALTAEILADLRPVQIWQVLSCSEPQTQADILSFLPLPLQEALFDLIDRDSLAPLIEAMSSDNRADLLARLDDATVEAILPLVAQAERADIRKLLSYPDGSAGSVMSTEYAWLPAEITVDEALSRLKTEAPTRETIYYVYVVDKERRLQGFLSLRRLVTADRDARLADVMKRDVFSSRVDDDEEDVARNIQRYDFLAMPIVDDRNRLVGIVTYDDAADILEAEATEDAQRLAAVEPLDDGYLDTPLFELAWKRGIWLVILLGAAFLTAAVLSMYEPSEGTGWMILFIPLVLASGGNAGSQSATLVIRTLALEDQGGRRNDLALAITRKEVTVGSVLGTGLAILAFVTALTLVETTPQAATVGLTVFLVVILGTITGALLPLGFRRLGVDPALMSNPLIAALVDVLGVVIYYEIASVVVGSTS